MRVFLTGVSGSDRSGYLEELKRLAALNKKPLKIYDVGTMILEAYQKMRIPVTPENILNVSENELAFACGMVYEQIAAEIGQHEHVVVSGHLSFFWNKVFIMGVKGNYLKKVQPDLYVTLIDNVKALTSRLQESAQWKPQNLSHEEILYWQNVEVTMAEFLAELQETPHYIVSRQLSRETLYKYMFHPDAPKVYLGFPLTYYTEDPTLIDEMHAFLNDYCTVQDPRGIEIDKDFLNEVDARQTRLRDLNWQIGKVDHVFILRFLDKDKKVVNSSGAMCEEKEAFERTKYVWKFYPKERKGPFEIAYSHVVFSQIEEMKKFVERKFRKLNIRRQ